MTASECVARFLRMTRRSNGQDIQVERHDRTRNSTLRGSVQACAPAAHDSRSLSTAGSGPSPSRGPDIEQSAADRKLLEHLWRAWRHAIDNKGHEKYSPVKRTEAHDMICEQEFMSLSRVLVPTSI